MIYINANKYILLLLGYLLILSGCVDWPGESWWWVSIDIDNQSISDCIVSYEKQERPDKTYELEVESKSSSIDQVCATRYSKEDKLSDNFEYLKILTEDHQIILYLSDNELDEQIPSNGEHKGDDKYLLTITDEMIEAALADRVENNIVE